MPIASLFTELTGKPADKKKQRSNRKKKDNKKPCEISQGMKFYMSAMVVKDATNYIKLPRPPIIAH
jgi:hypothetical protein